jgi:hypothetical protein
MRTSRRRIGAASALYYGLPGHGGNGSVGDPRPAEGGSAFTPNSAAEGACFGVGQAAWRNSLATRDRDRDGFIPHIGDEINYIRIIIPMNAVQFGVRSCIFGWPVS